MYKVLLISLLISVKAYSQEQFDIIRNCYRTPANIKEVKRYGLNFYTLTKSECFQLKMKKYFGTALQDDTSYNWQALLFWNNVSNEKFSNDKINIEVNISKMKTPGGKFISVTIFMQDINKNELLNPESKSYKKIKKEITKILNDCD